MTVEIPKNNGPEWRELKAFLMEIIPELPKKILFLYPSAQIEGGYNHDDFKNLFSEIRKSEPESSIETLEFALIFLKTKEGFEETLEFNREQRAEEKYYDIDFERAGKIIFGDEEDFICILLTSDAAIAQNYWFEWGGNISRPNQATRAFMQWAEQIGILSKVAVVNLNLKPEESASSLTTAQIREVVDRTLILLSPMPYFSRKTINKALGHALEDDQATSHCKEELYKRIVQFHDMLIRYEELHDYLNRVKDLPKEERLRIFNLMLDEPQNAERTYQLWEAVAGILTLSFADKPDEEPVIDPIAKDQAIKFIEYLELVTDGQVLSSITKDEARSLLYNIARITPSNDQNLKEVLKKARAIVAEEDEI